MSLLRSWRRDPFLKQADSRLRRLRFEPLEERRVLATFTVTNLLDGPVAAAGDLPGSLRQAVFDANELEGEDEIVFQNVSGTLPMTEGVFLVTDVVSLLGPGRDVLTIDAQQQSRVLDIDVFSPLSEMVITGLHLTNGRAPEGGAIRDRGGLGKLTIASSSITNSIADDIRGRGGGISAVILEIRESVISGNRTTGPGAYGAGVYSPSLVVVSDSVIHANTHTEPGSLGGGIFVGTGRLELTRTVVSDNRALQDGSSGAGVYSRSAVVLTDSTVSGNVSGGRGGGIYARALTMQGSTISGNRSLAPGAGLGIRQGGTINSSTITGNRVESPSYARGGGVLANGDLTVVNSIIAKNFAATSGPDLSSSNGQLEVRYSLIGDNSGNSLDEAQIPDSQGNLIGSNAGFGVIEPFLGPLEGNGGGMPTHALLAVSPAIDAGDPSIGFSPTEFDQRGPGFPRVFNSRIDIGAIERQSTDVADFDLDLDVDVADLMRLQRGFGTPFPKALPGDGDADRDLDVDQADLAAWDSQFGLGDVSPPVADFDSDGDVDVSDIMQLQRGFGIAVVATLSDGDSNADGDVDADDLTFLEARFGQGAVTVVAVAEPIPEPPPVEQPYFPEEEPTASQSGLVNAITYSGPTVRRESAAAVDAAWAEIGRGPHWEAPFDPPAVESSAFADALTDEGPLAADGESGERDEREAKRTGLGDRVEALQVEGVA